MTAKTLTNSGGATHGHTCPQCLRSVANVARSGKFGGYVPIDVPTKNQRRGFIMVDKVTGERNANPDSSVSTNWLFYGANGQRFLFKDKNGVPCSGDWGKHYHHHGASFLWLKVEKETSQDLGQMRLI